METNPRASQPRSTEALTPQRDKTFLNRAWRLVDTLIEGNQFISVIVAHTFMESILVLLVRMKLTENKHIPDEDFERMGFSQLLKWALALDALPSDLKGGLTKVNNFRNDFAHDPDHDLLTDEQINELKTTLPREIRLAINTGANDPDSVGYLSETLFAMSAELVRCLDSRYSRAQYFDSNRWPLVQVVRSRVAVTPSVTGGN